MPTVRFYFDYVSSNPYLAWTQLARLTEGYGVTVDPVPVLFAGLLGAYGQLGPAEVPAKAFWMGKNTLRKAALLGVPLNPPAFHPFNPLLALRASSLPLDPAMRTALIDAFWQAGGCDGSGHRRGRPLVGEISPWRKSSMAKVSKGAGRSRISIDLPVAVRRRLRVVAARSDVTLQEYVRRAVERQLAEDAPAAIRAEDDPVLPELWSNEADAVYDEL